MDSRSPGIARAELLFIQPIGRSLPIYDPARLRARRSGKGICMDKLNIEGRK
jgi:hypothetical protein